MVINKEMGHVTELQNQGYFSFGGVKRAGDIWADKKGADSWYGASRMRSASTFSSAFPYWRTFFKLGLNPFIFFCWRYGWKTSRICQSDYNYSLASSRAIVNAVWISSLSINMPSASTNLIYFPEIYQVTKQTWTHISWCWRWSFSFSPLFIQMMSRYTSTLTHAYTS